jgi:hypothetical protein
MALIKPSRSAQYPLVQEYIFSFGDTVTDIAGAAKDFKTFGGNPVFPMFNLPSGAVVQGGDIIVETPYAGTTAATLSVGDSGSATKYASTVDLMTGARTALTLPAATTGGLNVIGSLALTVANATAGKVRVRIMYTVEGRGQEVQST